MTLLPVDTSNALAVSDYLDRARQWLATAVEMTGPAEIAIARAEIATAAEAARQLGLSKNIREDATEMVRRAEYAVSRSIKKAQEEGQIRTQGQGGGFIGALRANSEKLPTVTDIAPDWRHNGSELASLGDAEPAHFEQIIEEAKSEGNLSRANVVRKVKGENETTPMTRQQRADAISDLAGQGYSSHQIADKVGVTAQRVREIARSFEIAIAADKAVGRQVRIDYTAAVESAVTSLDNWASSLSFIDFAEVDGTEADEWVASLNHSLIELRRFIKQIKETTHV